MFDMSKKPAGVRSRYYDSLINWEAVLEILQHFEPEEQEEALLTLLESIEHAVHNAILELLEEKQHSEFFVLLTERVEDPVVLDWLIERHDGVLTHIRESVRITKHSALQLIQLPDFNHAAD